MPGPYCKSRRVRIAATAIVIAAAVAVHPAAAGKFNKVLDVDDPAPTFSELEGIDGKRHTLADYKEHDILVLFFTDNHCPASRQYEPRLKALLREFDDERVAVVAVNVSRDSLESMQEHD